MCTKRRCEILRNCTIQYYYNGIVIFFLSSVYFCRTINQYITTHDGFVIRIHSNTRCGTIVLRTHILHTYVSIKNNTIRFVIKCYDGVRTFAAVRPSLWLLTATADDDKLVPWHLTKTVGPSHINSIEFHSRRSDRRYCHFTRNMYICLFYSFLFSFFSKICPQSRRRCQQRFYTVTSKSRCHTTSHLTKNGGVVRTRREIVESWGGRDNRLTSSANVVTYTIDFWGQAKRSVFLV